MTRRKSEPVVWKDPGLPKAQRYDWVQIAQSLRENPGEWALIFEQDRTSVVNALRQGAIKAIRVEDGFQIQTRNNTRDGQRTCSLYMRFVPPKKARRG